MRLHKKVIFGFLGLVLASAGYNVIETWRFQQQLTVDAERLVAEMKSGVHLDAQGEPSHDVISVVVASREYGFWGEPLAKITVFIRNNKKESVESKDGEVLERKVGSHDRGGTYTGVDYFYNKSDKGWVKTESSMCDSGECQVSGAKAFSAAGL